MHDASRLDRRTFIAELGRGALAISVLGLAACSPAATTAEPQSPAGGPTASGVPSRSPATQGGSLAWSRVNLGFVSAYVLVRDSEAAVVDTGVAGSADRIEEALAALGLTWSSVGHVVLTHHHADHSGSAAAVLERAPSATGYAGAMDIPSITTPRALVPVEDGDTVFSLSIVATPGHTPGHVCVHDEASGVLVAGDAVRIADGAPQLPDAQFTDDMDEAMRSVAKLGDLHFETLLVGHGDPIETGASGLVAALAAAR